MIGDSKITNLQVEMVENPSPRVMEEILALRREWPRDLAPHNLDVNGSRYCFLGRVPGLNDLFGFVSLKSYGRPQVYNLTIMTAVDEVFRGVATSLTTSVVGFAYQNPEIAGLSATMYEWEGSETILKRLRFKLKSRRPTRNGPIPPDRVTYELETPIRSPRH